jgi:hypothetical protein
MASILGTIGMWVSGTMTIQNADPIVRNDFYRFAADRDHFDDTVPLRNADRRRLQPIGIRYEQVPIGETDSWKSFSIVEDVEMKVPIGGTIWGKSLYRDFESVAKVPIGGGAQALTFQADRVCAESTPIVVMQILYRHCIWRDNVSIQVRSNQPVAGRGPCVASVVSNHASD